MNEFLPYLQDIESDAPRMRDLLISWCDINSGTNNSAGLSSMLEALKSEFSHLPGEMSVVALSARTDACGHPETELGKGLRLVCRPEAPLQVFLNGHMDTVYGPEHPFQKCRLIDQNTLNGPGVADMKGGLVVMLKALEAFERSPFAENLGWEVYIGPDEEIGSPGSADFLKKAAVRHQIGLVFESSLRDGSLIRRRKGAGTFSVVAKGRPAHVGRDFQNGRNAIVALSQIVLKVQDLNGEIPGAIFNVGKITGGGPTNIVPEYASAQINIRIDRKEDIAVIQNRIEALIEEANRQEGLHLEWEGAFSRAPKELTPQIEQLFGFYNNCAQDLALSLEWRDSGGCSDGNNLAGAGLPNLDTLGVRGGDIHSDKEHVFLDSLPERARLTALFLMKLASRKIVLPEMFYPANR